MRWGVGRESPIPAKRWVRETTSQTLIEDLGGGAQRSESIDRRDGPGGNVSDASAGGAGKAGAGETSPIPQWQRMQQTTMGRFFDAHEDSLGTSLVASDADAHGSLEAAGQHSPRGRQQLAACSWSSAIMR